MHTKIAENLSRVRENIAEACARVGRDPGEVSLVAVTKYVEMDAIRAIFDLGVHDLGESRVQQFVERRRELAEQLVQASPPGSATPRPRWHMVGHLQRNKVRSLLPVADYIHSVDSLRLAEEINTQAARLGLAERVNVFLQVNTSQEKQKFGLAVGAVNAMAEQLMTLPNLQLVGLMAMAPHTEDMDECRFCFGRLQEIFEELQTTRLAGPEFRHLSMGMSNDYTVAVEMGATMIRLGSALFTQVK